MEQNNNNNQAINNNPATGEKTFSQEEVNRIVSDRLARERDKRTAELDEREQAIKARELAVLAAEKLAEAGLPKDLGAVLRYDDEASLDAAISQLSKLQGFSNGKKDNKDGYKVFMPNKLPESTGDYGSVKDPIKDAFRVHDNE